MRLIDADRYKEELESLIEICDFEGEDDVKEGIQSAIHTLDSENFTPTIDITYCKDCKYGSRDPFDMRPIWCIYFNHYRNETDFCSRGERKDEED